MTDTDPAPPSSGPPPVLITGLPRSGTTLTVKLLNDLPDCVAMAEPLPVGRMSRDPETFADEVAAFAAETRARALREGQVRSKAVAGRIAGNFVTRADAGTGGKRRSEARLRDVAVDKPLSPGFRLCIKHPAAFTALADVLARRFPFYACLRAPLGVLAAWQTVDMAVSRGRLPMAERYDPALAARLDALPDALDRQVAILQYCLETYARLPAERVLRFEDLQRDPAAHLARIHPGAALPPMSFESQDLARRYPSVDLDRLRAALRPIAPLVRRFYPEGPAG